MGEQWRRTCGESCVSSFSLGAGSYLGLPVPNPSSSSPQPFRCAHCHYSCNISGSLKRHYNRKHPNEEYANVGTGELAADALIQQGRWAAALRGSAHFLPARVPIEKSCDILQYNPNLWMFSVLILHRHYCCRHLPPHRYVSASLIARIIS